ncbi:MAG TPA: ROK family protein [Candidatus Saccharimonadales bacterium]|nr:ROK family protein [Candidatus Saccharimonadales bacterium]
MITKISTLPYALLTSRPVPELFVEQLAKFTLESIHAEKVMPFDVMEAEQVLLRAEDALVLGADFGGDKGVTRLFRVKNGRLTIHPGYEDYVQADHGAGYLQSLERTAVFARRYNVPIGISWGAPIEGSKPLFHPKAKQFLYELNQKYDGDLQNVVPNLRAVMNDGPAGLISGAMEVARRQEVTVVELIINGGGLGGAVLVDNTLFSIEAGHVEGVAALNTYHQKTECGVYGATHTCIEQLGANKAGIEAQWQQLTGQYARAIEIENQYKAGDELAADLYDHSSFVAAHQVAGVAQAFGMDIGSTGTVIVGHGGAFKFPYYGERIVQILEAFYETRAHLIMTKDYTHADSNACLDGAAFAALVAGS